MVWDGRCETPLKESHCEACGARLQSRWLNEVRREGLLFGREANEWDG